METIPCNPGIIKKSQSLLEEKLKVKIKTQPKQITISGAPLDEYEPIPVIEAINFGFPIETSLLLKEPDMIFEKINIKSITRRKNLKEVRARIIGTERRTLDTLESLADCSLILKNNELAVIAFAESIDEITTALTNLIKGTKQSNVYKFLEKTNKSKRKESESLGIKK